MKYLLDKSGGSCHKDMFKTYYMHVLDESFFRAAMPPLPIFGQACSN